jgi:16S rRNA G527 N7-methylase RsmG
VRTLNRPTAVHAARVENLPPTTTFDCIALRAVDDMQAATSTAVRTLGPAGWLALMTTSEQDTPDGALLVSHHPIPRTLHTELSIYRITQ